jgi:hypothetical protein
MDFFLHLNFLTFRNQKFYISACRGSLDFSLIYKNSCYTGSQMSRIFWDRPVSQKAASKNSLIYLILKSAPVFRKNLWKYKTFRFFSKKLFLKVEKAPVFLKRKPKCPDFLPKSSGSLGVTPLKYTKKICNKVFLQKKITTIFWHPVNV